MLWNPGVHFGNGRSSSTAVWYLGQPQSELFFRDQIVSELYHLSTYVIQCIGVISPCECIITDMKSRFTCYPERLCLPFTLKCIQKIEAVS